jgi:HemY protein
MRALPALIVIAALVAIAALIAEQAGTVSITWQGWAIDTSVPVLAGATLLLGLLIAISFMLLRAILGSPRAIRRARRERRRRLGYRALTQGMVAVAAGDPEEANKLARRADTLLAEPPLTLLLSAQAAQLAGDESAATRYFTAMLERAETEFLGLRGLLMQAMKSGDDAAALRLAERAKALRPKTPWVLTHLAELQARAGQWIAAEGTLIEAERRKVLSKEAAQHRHAVTLYEQSRAADAAGRAGEAMRLAAKAHAKEPGFAPAAHRYAKMLMERGALRRARRVLAAAWALAPHPMLAEVWRNLPAGESAVQRLKHMERLAAQNIEHEESRIAMARAALEARLWGEARRYLEPLVKDRAEIPPRICRLMADLEDSEGEDQRGGRAWLARAATTPALDPAWVCEECGAETPTFSATCPSCRAFATLQWHAAGRAPAPAALSDPAAMAAKLLPGRS